MPPPVSLPQFGTFYGEITKRCEFLELTLTETAYPPEYQVPLHHHDLPWFGFVLEGSIVEILGKKSFHCKPLTLLYRVPDERHANRSGSQGSRCLTVELKELFFRSFVQSSGILRSSGEFDGGLLPTLMLRLYDEFHSLDNVSPLSIEGLALELVAESHRRSSILAGTVPPVWVKRAREMVRQQFTESLSLTKIASEIGTHPVQLARAFRKYYGYSVGEYVRKLRVDYAYNELLASEAPVVDIALATGFCDQAHFCRTFKRLTGMNPSELRTSRRLRAPRAYQS
jgi:AraC family transcriptional regulator